MTEVLGVSAEAALRAATSDAAASIGLGAVTGRIQPGMGADFLVLRGRPWERIEDRTPANIAAVVCRGVVAAGELPLAV